jgi:hypothetical protein
MKRCLLAFSAVLMLTTAAPADANCGGPWADHIFVDRFDPFLRPVAGDLVFTEVMAAPLAVPETDGEWFELLNRSNKTVELCGCFLLNLQSISTVIPPIRMRPAERIVLARSRDPARNGGIDADGLFGFSLANVDGTLIIQCGSSLDTITWPTSAPGRSWTLDPTFSHPDFNNSPAAWCFPATPTYNASGDAGTPGQPNVDC